MRRNVSKDDRAFQQELEESLKVSSYADKIAEAIVNKSEVQTGIVPNYKPGGSSSPGSTANESSGFSLDYESLAASPVIGGLEISSPFPGGMPYDVRDTSQTKTAQTQTRSDRPKFTISKNQYSALQKFPALIEFLGTDQGESIAKEIFAKVNSGLAEKIAQNSREVNKNASVCKSDKNCMKQYFVGDNDEWVCVVIASGPFSGDEVIYYSKDKDESCVLRKDKDEFINVSGDFNVVHEYMER